MFEFINNSDILIFRAINGLCGSNPILDRLASNSDALVGPLFLGMVGLFWFKPYYKTSFEREIIIMILFSVALALILNRGISTLVPFRERPMYSIGANAPTFRWRPDLENWSSFPSDHATYLFAIAAGFWRISRVGGALFGVFALLVSTSRVFLGIHFPADILVGALIGIATSAAATTRPIRAAVAGRIFRLEGRYTAIFYFLFFATLAEVSGVFQATRHVGVAIVHIFVPYKESS
ncbi:undecaprenyl-diphosphatase [Bradyrhizobium sp. USDA 4449]